MNSIWNKNIAAFKNRFPALADLYHDIIEEISLHGDEKGIFSFWNIIRAKNGSLTAQIDNMLLHSSYNPEREAQSAAGQLVAKEKETVIFMGVGLGWQVCSLAQLMVKSVVPCPVKKLVIVEPDPVHFFGALYYIDWSGVFDVEQLIIAVGCPENSLMGLLEGGSINTGMSGVSAAYVYVVPAFIQHARAYFDSVIALIERNRSKNEINAATYKKFEKLWIRNSMKNLVHIGECATVSQLAEGIGGGAGIGGAAGLGTGDFILVAAGPTLETLLPKISEWAKQAVIICVETALHALLKAGIQPDFIVITDPQYYAYRHIAGLSSPGSILVCPLSVHPAVFRFKCKQIVLCSEMFPVSSYFESKLGAFGDLGAGGSVASSAWNLCRLLGARNIYLAGLDLSYPAGQTHIKGSSAEEAFLCGADRLATMQDKNSTYRFSANPETAVDYDGNPVLTDARMKMFAWWFESRIAACPEVKTWSLSSKSMKIPGVEVAEDVGNGALREPQGVVRYANSTSFLRKLAHDYINQTVSSLIPSFYSNLRALSALINLAVEKCIIGGPELETQLAQIETQIAASPLAEIVRLARPADGDKLKIYQSLQRTMSIYIEYMSVSC
ncbi:MAG: motility associated factor glycosyltransferase family protein [Treponema sp.]|nr:motility associated factor glycosyltransferase family protein [Treponema sp.]